MSLPKYGVSNQQNKQWKHGKRVTKIADNVTSTADYKNNVVTIESSQSSSEAGSLDPSSAVNFVNNNLKVYNVNFANTYGQGAQVSHLL